MALRARSRVLAFATAMLMIGGVTAVTATPAAAINEPVLTWLNPPPGGTVSGTLDITVLATAVDPALVVKWCLLKDGVPVGTEVTPLTELGIFHPVLGNPFNPSTGCWSGSDMRFGKFEWDTTAWPNGSHTYQAIVTDSLGATSSTAVVTLTNINGPPTFKWEYPVTGTTVKGVSGFVATGAPDPSGTASITKWCAKLDGVAVHQNLGGGLLVPTDLALHGAFNASTGCWIYTSIKSGEFDIDTAKLINGKHTLSVTVTDTSGRTASAPIVFTASNRKAPTQVTAGARHSCARVVDGTVRCWGSNDSGQLGDGSLISTTAPHTVPGLIKVVAVAAGGSHTCAVTTVGQVKCWGANLRGQLGTNNHTASLKPTAVLASGGAALTAVASVATGKAFSCAVVTPGSNGRVYCWGEGTAGQLGNGANADSSVPVLVTTPTGGTLRGVVSVAAGRSSACAVLATGAVRCWGQNTYGQLGNGTTVASNRARPVSGIDGLHARATMVSVGDASACVRLSTSGARCWGRNNHGQLGNGTHTSSSVPVAVKVKVNGADLTKVAIISVGGSHACAVVGTLGARDIGCWGENTDGQLGIGTTFDTPWPTRVQGGITINATALAAGPNHTLAVIPSAVRPPSDVSSWGSNATGQLGVAGAGSKLRPVIVTKIF